jgi:septal ring factor EnvC (AmiA/AmiB activator)
MRAAILVVAPALLAASAPVQPVLTPLDAQLRAARADLAAAERQTALLEQAAANARGEAARLQAQQAAAAQAIDAAEARITAADAQLRLVAATLSERRQRLASEQRPLASLLAGLATFGQQPPLLAIADNASVDELVEVRALFDATMPVIRKRTAALSAELRQNDGLLRSLEASRAETLRSRQALVDRRQRFAALQSQAIASAEASASRALSTGDVGIAAGETVEQLEGGAAASRNAAALAAALAALGPAPPRPGQAASTPALAPFAYQLPANGAVTEGLGAVSANGVRSRGLALATPRGSQVAAPASGTIRFSGPFRDYDGVVIIDHGGGWMTLLVNVASELKPGDTVSIGQPIGRVLGPVGVELSQNGRRISPALIAGSSQTLSKTGKGG